MNLSLEGKNALVGGSSKGIGKAIAIELAHLGANVTLMARSKELLESVIGSLPILFPHQDHQYLLVDHNDLDDLHKKVNAQAASKDFHILINNTGGPPAGKLHEVESHILEDSFKKLLLVNHELVKLLLPGMKSSGYGRIINITSTSVKEPLHDLGISNSLRAAVSNWAKTLANELGQFNITVNNVMPGYTSTERLSELLSFRAQHLNVDLISLETKAMEEIPMRRFGKPEEIASVVAFLASPAASYVNGVSIAVDGGRTKSM